MFRSLFLGVSALLLTGTATADPAWPEMFRKAVSVPDGFEAPVLAYDYVFATPAGKELARIAYDGSAAPDEQFKFLFVDKSMAGRRGEMLSNASTAPEEIWCDDIADTVKGGVKTLADENGMSVFTYTPTDDEIGTYERKALERTEARMLVDKVSGKPAAISYKLEKPYSPILFLAKVNDFFVSAECKATPVGRPYRSRVEMMFDVTIMGDNEREHTVERIENLRFPGLELP